MTPRSRGNSAGSPVLAQAVDVLGPGLPYRTCRDFLQALTGILLDDLLPEPSGDPYPHSTAEAIRRTLDDLRAADPDGAARGLLDQVAVLAPTGVDPSLLALLTEDEGAVDVLVDWSLASWSEDGDWLVPHPLVRLVALEGRASALDDLLLIDTAGRIELAASEPGTRWHTRAALADLARHAHALGTHGAGDAARHAVVELQLFMLISLCDASEPDTAIELATVMSRDAARIAGHEDAHALNILAVTVLCLAHTGRTAEGVALGGRVAAELERLLGPEHPDALTAWLHVAANHWNGGQPDPAIEIA